MALTVDRTPRITNFCRQSIAKYGAQKLKKGASQNALHVAIEFCAVKSTGRGSGFHRIQNNGMKQNEL